MKTIFKSLAIAALFVGIGSTASAQLGAQQSVTVNAKILKRIVINKQDDVRFGTIQANAGETFLNPQSQAASLNVGATNSGPGRLWVDASSLENVRVEFPEFVNMSSGSADITFIPVVSVLYGEGLDNAGDRSTSLLLSDEALIMPTTGPWAGAIPTGSSNATGRGPFRLFNTNPVSGAGFEFSTLYIGGYLVANASSTYTTGHIPTWPADQVIITGTFTGTMNFNILYQ